MDGADGQPLQFRTIQLPRDGALCLEFVRDAYTCSFGGTELFDRDHGAGGRGYLDRLAARIADFPQGHVHLWMGPRIVGQLEMQPRGRPPSGYINMFCLHPSVRGSGLADALHAYALSEFASLGVRRIQLSVSPSNQRALRFYLRHGWRDLGPRPDASIVNLMERALEDPPLTPAPAL